MIMQFNFQVVFLKKYNLVFLFNVICTHVQYCSEKSYVLYSLSDLQSMKLKPYWLAWTTTTMSTDHLREGQTAP